MQNFALSADATCDDDNALRAFEEFLRGRGYASIIIHRYLRFMRRVGQWRHRHRAGLLDLHASDTPSLLRHLLRGRRTSTVSQCRCSLDRWFDFRGEDRRPRKQRHAAWQSWCDAYRSFLVDHRGLLPDSVTDNIRESGLLLDALFGSGGPRWDTVSVEQIWRYCERCARGAKPGYTNKRLFAVRRFLQFVHARDGCRAELFNAVPHIASFVVATPPTPALTESQRQQLLRAFPIGILGARRDLAMCRCMLDLGLRSAEVARLRLPDLDWPQRVLAVPAIKRGRVRHVPIPAAVFRALRDYLENERPATASDALFVRTRTRIGQPITAMAVQAAAVRAYRRAGLPHAWHGSHRLRHTFATRLFARGATLKEIADLLGHRQLDSANLYTRVDLELLRRIAVPWPV